MSGDGKGEERPRPNAGYSLSHTRDDLSPDEIVHHYDRERRLEKAPQSVRDFYEGKPEPRRGGFLRNIRGGRPQLLMLIVIFIVSVMALIATIVGNEENTVVVDGNRVSAQAFLHDGAAILVVSKIAAGGRGGFLGLGRAVVPYVGAAEIAARPADGGAGAFSQIVRFSDGPQSFSFTLPFSSEEIDVSVATGGGEATLRIRVERPDD